MPPPGMPGMDNYGMTVDAKARERFVFGIDLTASGAQLIPVGEYIRSGHVFLEGFLRTRAANGANEIIVKLGTAADDDALGSVTIAALAAAGKKSFTLAATLASDVKGAKKRPVVPKGTPLYVKYTGAADCPIVDYGELSFPLDENDEN